MPAMLRLYEDTFAADGALHGPFAAMPRMLFIVHGSAIIEGCELHDDEAWFGEGPVLLAPGRGGVTCWRFELASSTASGAARGRGVVSREKLTAQLDMLPK